MCTVEGSGPWLSGNVGVMERTGITFFFPRIIKVYFPFCSVCLV